MKSVDTTREVSLEMAFSAVDIFEYAFADLDIN